MATAEELRARPQNRSAEELTIRARVATELRRLYPDARIIHELPLRYSSNRIDVAAVRPSAIISAEIKSSRDVIDRLEAQLRAFQPVSYRLIVATAQKHADAARSVTARVSTGDVWTVDPDTGKLDGFIEEAYYHRSGMPPWGGRMLDMLWRDELALVAARHQVPAGIRPTHTALRNACAAALTGRQAVEAVCRALRTRAAFDKASDPPLAAQEGKDHG